MAEQDDREAKPGTSRRQLIQRGAAVGGVLWAVPVIESFTNSASAQVGSPPPDGPRVAGVAEIAYIAILVSFNGACTVVKIDSNGNTAVKAPGATNPKTPCCSDMTNVACLVGSATRPDGLVAEVVDEDGFQRITLPVGCVLLDYRVHCGQCCDGPGATGQPSLSGPLVGSFVFNRCSGTGNDAKPCSAVGNEKIPCGGGGGGGTGGTGGGGGKKQPKVSKVGAAPEAPLDDESLGHPAESHVDPL